MIDVKLYKNNSSYKDSNNIYSIKSILIIGKGKYSGKSGEIYKPKSYEEAYNLYGESDLLDAYNAATMYGCIDNTFFLNAYKTTDFIECVNILKHYSFMYIVPISINIDTKLYISKYEKEMYLIEYYLLEITESRIICTDRKAELYEDIDDYINDMSNKVITFKEQCQFALTGNGSNLYFICNNLKNIKYSNIILSFMLSKSVPGVYPSEISEEVVFDIDNDDITVPEIIFFKSNHLIGTTVENLNNFRTIFDQNKIITIYTVIKYIERTVDLSFVNGKFYNKIIQLQLLNALEEYLDKMRGVNIHNYKVISIDFIGNKDTRCGYFLINLDLYIINSLEKISASLEVS